MCGSRHSTLLSVTQRHLIVQRCTFTVIVVRVHPQASACLLAVITAPPEQLQRIRHHPVCPSFYKPARIYSQACSSCKGTRQPPHTAAGADCCPSVRSSALSRGRNARCVSLISSQNRARASCRASVSAWLSCRMQDVTRTAAHWPQRGPLVQAGTARELYATPLTGLAQPHVLLVVPRLDKGDAGLRSQCTPVNGGAPAALCRRKHGS